MKTIVVQIGNSDDKLSQATWAEFIAVTGNVIEEHVGLHFNGGSNATAPWQNYCWVGQIPQTQIDKLRDELAMLGKKYEQDSIAVTIGETEFV